MAKLADVAKVGLRISLSYAEAILLEAAEDRKAA